MLATQDPPASGAVNDLQLGIEAAHAGRREDARILLVEAARKDPSRELPWLWLASLARNPSETRYCLERALEVTSARGDGAGGNQRPSRRTGSPPSWKASASVLAGGGAPKSPWSVDPAPKDPDGESGKDPQPPKGTGSSPRILVVDDSPLVRRVTEISLRQKGYEVTLAEDGLEGLSAIETSIPDLVVVDLEMPKLDGLQLCQILRKTPEASGIPIIMLTGQDSSLARLRGSWVGVDAFLSKPISPAALQRSVEALLKT